MSSKYLEKAYETCLNLTGNCVPWKIIDGKSVQLPPMDKLKFCDWQQLDQQCIYDLIFVSSDNLAENLTNVTKHVFEHGKIYVVFDGDRDQRNKFLDHLITHQIVMIDERMVDGKRHFVFRPPRVFTKPPWDGQKNCKILVHDGAGFGDEFFFGRFIELMQLYNNKVIFEARPEIYRFAKHFSKFDDVVLKGCSDSVDYDFQVNFYKIENFFGRKSQVKLPYFWGNVPESHRLASKCRLKIGFVYKGGFNKYRVVRKYELSEMQKLKNIKADLYCFQKNFDYESKHTSEDWFVDLSSKIEDWYDTACYVSQMDYIITPDTAMLHLASSMGVKTKVFLKHEHTNSYIDVNQSNCVFYPFVLDAFWGDNAIENIVKTIRRDGLL